MGGLRKMDERKNKLQGYLLILLTTLIFSTMEVALKMPAISGAFAPMQITLERFLIGGLVLLPFAARDRRRRGVALTGKDHRRLMLTGLFCVPISMVFYQMAVVYGKAGIVGILFSSNPIFVTILAAAILGEKIRWYHIVGIVLEILGIVAIINPFSPGADISMVSVILVACSTVTFALYCVLGKGMTARCGGLTVTCGSFVYGGIELLTLLLLGYLPPVANFLQRVGLHIFCRVPFFSGFTLQTLPYFLYICLVVTMFGYICHMSAIEKTSASTGGLVFFFKPALAPVIALIVLGEPITQNVLIGIGFFLTGSFARIVPDILSERRAATAAQTETVRPEE